MSRISMITATLALVVTTIAVGKEGEPVSNYEHLKAYDALIGEWVYEGKVQEEVPDGPKKGTPFIVKASWKWILGKNVIEEQWQSAMEDGTIAGGKNLVGWDPKNKMIFVKRTNSAGGCDEGTVVMDSKGRFISKSSGIDADGNEFSATYVMTIIGPDKFVFQATDRSGGPLTGDSPEWAFRRAKQPVSASAVQDVKLPKKFINVSQYFVGEWKTEGEIDGTVYRGTWKANWSRDKTCLVSYWAADTPTGRAAGTRIQGWDALAKRMLVVDFGTDGSSSIERYVIVSEHVDEGEIIGVDSEGEPRKAVARTFRKERDFFTWTVTEDDKKTEYTFRRVKK